MVPSARPSSQNQQLPIVAVGPLSTATAKGMCQPRRSTHARLGPHLGAIGVGFLVVASPLAPLPKGALLSSPRLGPLSLPLYYALQLIVAGKLLFPQPLPTIPLAPIVGSAHAP